MFWQTSQDRTNKLYACFGRCKAHSPKDILQQINSDAGRITVEHQNHRPATVESPANDRNPSSGRSR